MITLRIKRLLEGHHNGTYQSFIHPWFQENRVSIRLRISPHQNTHTLVAETRNLFLAPTTRSIQKLAISVFQVELEFCMAKVSSQSIGY